MKICIPFGLFILLYLNTYGQSGDTSLSITNSDIQVNHIKFSLIDTNKKNLNYTLDKTGMSMIPPVSIYIQPWYRFQRVSTGPVFSTGQTFYPKYKIAIPTVDR